MMNTKFKENHKLFFSHNNKYEINFLEKHDFNNLYFHANNVVQYGWNKEALPVVKMKKSQLLQEYLSFLNKIVILRNISCFKSKSYFMYKTFTLQIYQQSLAKPVSFEGVGLHTGANASLTIYPAKENSGILFKRVDLLKNNLIKANYKNVTSAKLCTTLENEHGVKVSTVEHLLAALYIAEIDNAIIEINTQEIPIMDGSAKEFLSILKKSEKTVLEKKRKFLKIKIT